MSELRRQAFQDPVAAANEIARLRRWLEAVQQPWVRHALNAAAADAAVEGNEERLAALKEAIAVTEDRAS